MRTVGVIIPYYQKEPGLLARAVASVADQDLPADVDTRIIVVDDGSPLPAARDLQGLASRRIRDLSILRQANGGAGAARNAGLDLLEEVGAEFVAFLDSDDYWYPQHLRTALKHLRRSDFYFANCMGDAGDHFAGAPFIRRHHKRTDIGQYEPVTGSITGAEFRRALLEQSFLSTSQVAYRLQKFASFRFDTDQRRAGEDYLFWMAISKVCTQVAYSTRPMGYRGRGVSIHRETLSWDSLDAADRLIDELKVLRKIGAFNRDEGARAMLGLQCRRLRDELMLRLLRLLRRHPARFARTVGRLAWELPGYILHAPLILLRTPLIVKRSRSRTISGNWSCFPAERTLGENWDIRS